MVAREHELAAQERRDRAAAQAQRVKEREQAASAEAGQRPERLVPSAPMPAASHPARTRARSPEQAVKAQREAERQAEAEAAHRRAQAQERLARQQQRVAEHEAKQKNRLRPPAAPLPVPGVPAASAASR